MMKFLLILFLLSLISCTNESTINQIDGKLLELVSDDLSYDEPLYLMRLIQNNNELGLSIEKKYDFKKSYTQYIKIQKKLKAKNQAPAKIKPEIISFYNEINLKFKKRNFPVLNEIFETINLKGELENMNDTSVYDVIRFKTAIFFNHYTQFVHSTFNYHPMFDCNSPTVYSTDTINENDPITFFFGHVYPAPNCTIKVNQINDNKVDISFTLDSLTGISSLVIHHLKKGTNTISGQYKVPSQKDSKFDFTSPFDKVIYVK